MDISCPSNLLLSLEKCNSQRY